MEHSTFGPSRAGLYSLCPAAYRETLRVGDERSPTADQARGTAIHAVAMGRQDPDTLSDFDRFLALRGRDFLEDRSPVFTFRSAANEVRLPAQGHLPIPIRGEGSLCLALFGTLDRLELYSDQAEVWDVAVVKDLKTGGLPVRPERVAPQMAMYAALVFTAYPEVETVFLLAKDLTSGAEYSDEFGRRHLPELLARIERLAQSVTATAPNYSPGPHTCPLCPAQTTCEAAYQRMELAVASGDLKPAPWKTMAPARIVEVFEQAKFVKSLAEAVIGELTEEARQQPGFVPGWQLHTQEKRSLISDTAAGLRAAKILGTEAALAAASFSVGPLQKAIGNAGGGKNDAERRRIFDNEFKEIIERKESSWLIPSSTAKNS